MLDRYAFGQCTSLTSVIVPEGSTEIRYEVFRDCSKLTSVVIPNCIAQIEGDAFSGCNNLIDVYYAGTEAEWNNIQIMGGNSCLTNSTIHYNTPHICTLTEVPAKAPSYDEDGNNTYWACSDCSKVYKDSNGSEETTVEAETLPKLPCVDHGTCGENLTWVLTEDGVLTISGTGDMEDYSTAAHAPWYQYAEQIVSVNLEPGITTIGTYAFWHCIPPLSVVNIPDGVTRIKSGAFNFCGSLFVYFPRSITNIDEGAFGTSVSVHPYYGGSEAEWKNVQIGYNNSSLNYNMSTVYYNEYFVRFNATHACDLMQVPAQAPTDSQDGSFEYWICRTCHQTYRDRNGVCKTTGAVPEVIPAGSIYWRIIDNIGHGSIVVSKDGILTVSGNGVMSDRSNRYFGYGDPEKIRAVKVEQGITVISDIAGLPNLTSIFVPTSVTKINDSFNGCDSLSDIYYSGTEEDWNRIEIKYTDVLENVTIHFVHTCTLTEVPAKAPSYDEDGNNAYWVCSDCGKVYKDANGSEETTVEAETLPKLPCVDHGTCGENLTWVLTEDGTLAISGTGDMRDFSWSTYAPWYKYREQIVSASIEAGVSSIGTYTFYGCSALANVIIPESVTSIGYYAFSGCSSLTDVKISDSVTSIGSYAFDGCSSLTSVYIPDGVTKLDDAAFENCSSLVSVTLPLGITGINRMMFNNCNKLRTVFIPQSVTSISSFVFHMCDSLSVVYYGGTESQWNNISISEASWIRNDVVVHYNSTHICTLEPVAEQAPTTTQDGNHAYWLCSICQQAYKDAGGIAKTTVEAETIPAGTIAYGSCGQYLSWTLHSNGELVIYGSGSMNDYSQGSAAPWNRYRKDIVSLTVMDGVTSIGEYAFYSCYRLSAVSIAPSVAKFGQNAFDSCTRLTDVVLPEGVTTISCSAFTGCTGLQSIVIPESVTSIESAAFYNCSSLTGVTIPKGVTAIGGLTFYGCGSLTYVSIPEGVTSIGNNVFHGCSKLEEIKLPETLTRIDGNAFYNCTSLTNVVIPESATDIAGGTFMGCTGLTSVVLPSEIAYIPASIFSGCTNLTNVIIPESVVKIDDYAFGGCSSLTTIVVPEGVTTIGSAAFQNCRSLTGLLIPESLTNVGNGAFSGCASLNVVYYAGEKADWDNIQIGTDNSSLIGSVIRYNATHICTLTEIPAKAPTYAEDGNNQYWVCSVCQQAYKDAWGKVETTVEAETIPGKPCIAAGTCGQGINWVLTEDGVMILSGSGAMEDFAASGDAPWDAHRARITAVVIPVEITAIGSHAFDSCENLTMVCYAGTAEQWANVQIGSGNASLTGAPVRYNTDHMCLLTEVPEKEPTYVEDGHNTYWVCAICQKLYKDAQGTEETTAEAEAIPKLPSVAAGTCGENIIWALGEDGVMDVFGTGPMTSFTCVGNTTWQEVKYQIRSVVIAEGVTSVAGFWDCSNLTSTALR